MATPTAATSYFYASPALGANFGSFYAAPRALGSVGWISRLPVRRPERVRWATLSTLMATAAMLMTRVTRPLRIPSVWVETACGRFRGQCVAAPQSCRRLTS
jgi:hypothetical protein